MTRQFGVITKNYMFNGANHINFCDISSYGSLCVDFYAMTPQTNLGPQVPMRAR